VDSSLPHPEETGMSALSRTAFGYRTQSPDTSRKVESILIEAYRRMSTWEKVRRVTEMTRACEQLARIGIQARHPEATGREVYLRLAALKLDRETMVRAFGWDPEQEGY
jgi:hypothetical protein